MGSKALPVVAAPFPTPGLSLELCQARGVPGGTAHVPATPKWGLEAHALSGLEFRAPAGVTAVPTGRKASRCDHAGASSLGAGKAQGVGGNISGHKGTWS